ncbi:hypothetical protein [Paraburkholderia monticola]|nr:hypothetical protein [Paraburkholderia monticola]
MSAAIVSKSEGLEPLLLENTDQGGRYQRLVGRHDVIGYSTHPPELAGNAGGPVPRALL